MRVGLADQRELTFLVSFVRLLPLAMISPSLVMTHLEQQPRQSDVKTLASCIAQECGCRAVTDPHPIGTSPRASAFLACIGASVMHFAASCQCRKGLAKHVLPHLSKGLTHKGQVFCCP